MTDQAQRRLTDYGRGVMLDRYKRMLESELEQNLWGKIRGKTPMSVDTAKPINIQPDIDTQPRFGQGYGPIRKVDLQNSIFQQGVMDDARHNMMRQRQVVPII